MKLSTKGRYGLRAMVDLAQYGAEEPVAITGIASRQDISERYLEQLMSMLKKAGLVKSIRGATGGYMLGKKPEAISVGDVLRALEGSLEAVECGAFHPEKGCASSGNCVTKYVWQQVNDSIRNTVDSITLEQLVKESEALAAAGNTDDEAGYNKQYVCSADRKGSKET